MEGDSSGQSHVALNVEPDGVQHGNSVLTVRETDDQEMGLAVAILELIGSQPHVQVAESHGSENQEDGIQQVQVLEISQTETQDHIHAQEGNVVSITEISESQKDAIHALETLVQIGHTGHHEDIGHHLEHSQEEHVVIQFETAGVDQEVSQFKVAKNANEEGNDSEHQSNLNGSLCIPVSNSSNIINDSEPTPKRIAVPPVTHTTTSPRTRSKVRKELEESSNTNRKSSSKQLSEPEMVQDGVAAEISSPRTRQAEKVKKMEQKVDDQNDDKSGTKKTPKKRAVTKRSPGVRNKRPRNQLSEQSENENSGNRSVDSPLEDKTAHLCPTCAQPFTRKDNLKVHMRKKHEEELVEPKSAPKLTCFHPECGVTIYHTSRMIEHMEKDHGLVYQKQHLEFDSFEEFQRWKDEEEAAKFVQFTSSSKEKLTSQGVKSLYFKCQKDGNDQPHRKKGQPGRLTDRKAHKGSVKSNMWCPARINAKLNTKTGHVSVFYIQSHSHPISYEDTKHHRLPELLRKEIMAKFARGISIDEIYNDLHKPRDMENNASPLLNKQHYVSKRFLYMLRTKVTSSKKLHEDEKTSVRLLVEKLKSESFDPVLMFKAANENTIEGDGLASYAEHIQHIGEGTYVVALQAKEQLTLLERSGNKAICIDATHTVNRWGIQLVTLFVGDDYQNSYPVAYLLSNQVDGNILKAFILSIKARCPTFAPLILITDEDNTGLAQFEEIFGQGCFSHFLSKWHIHQAWLKQLKHLVPIISMRQEMYHCLVILLEEKNVRIFDYLVNAFLSHYADKCQVFTDYFQVTYASRPMKWAMCFLTADNVACKYMFQDSFHDQVKNFYTQKRKSNKRVDFLTNILLEIAKNDSWCRNTQQFQQPCMKASGNKVLSNHERGTAIPSGNVKEEGPPDQLWKVSIDSSGDPPKIECHEVRKLKEFCDEEFCYHKCLELPCFNLCRHLYRCSCVEETQICQHIHKVHMLRVAQIYRVPQHMQSDHVDLAANVVELSCSQEPVDDDHDDGDPEETKQITNLKQQCQDMFSLLKDGRVRQLLLQHVCSTVSDLVATCEAVQQGAVTVTYEQQPVEPEGEQTAVAEQIIAIPIVETQPQNQ
ncbi:uncharacterized protein [Amphiura filiformis]